MKDDLEWCIARRLHGFGTENQDFVSTKSSGRTLIILPVGTSYSRIRVGNRHPFSKKRADMGRLAEDGGLQQEKKDSVSALGPGRRDER